VDILKDPAAPKKSVATPLSILALIIAFSALWLVFFGEKVSVATINSSREIPFLDNNTLNVGYGSYPPYTIEDLKEPENPQVQGFSADIIREIASRASPPLEVHWHKFSFTTLKADLESRKFDVIADPVFFTVPRAKDFLNSIPYSYFGIAAGVVAIKETRFKTFSDLDDSNVTIALAEGWTSSEYARKHLKKPKFLSIATDGSAVQQLDAVITGRADIALNDVPTIMQFVAAHPKKVKAIWITSPPSMVPGGFLLRKDSMELKNFLDASLEILIVDGTLVKLDKKWATQAFLPSFQPIPGQGLVGE